MQIIHIQWQGPFELSRLSEFNDEAIDYGVYQIYGTHPVYGQNKLLYVGKASEQTFAKRIGQEDWLTWEYHEGAVEIRIGRLAGDKTPDNATWAELIGKAEAILINAHKPAYNSALVGDLTEAKDKSVQDIHVLNWGDYGSLLPEVSGARWTWKLVSEKYDIFGNGT